MSRKLAEQGLSQVLLFTKALPREPFVSRVRTCSARRLRGYGGGKVATPGPFLQPIPVLCRVFRGAPGGAFFGLQRVGPETTLQWRNVSPMMLVMLAWRRPMMLLMLANDLVPPGCKSKSSSRLHFELHPPT